MLKVRLKRVGRKHDPSFRIVVVENTKAPQGGYLESVGFYNAMQKQVQLKKERIQYWMGVGAQPTAVVHNILVQQEVIQAPKIAVHKRSKKKEQQEETPKSEDAKQDEKAEATQTVQDEKTEEQTTEKEQPENKNQEQDASAKEVAEKQDKPDAPDQKQDTKTQDTEKDKNT